MIVWLCLGWLIERFGKRYLKGAEYNPPRTLIINKANGNGMVKKIENYYLE